MSKIRVWVAHIKEINGEGIKKYTFESKGGFRPFMYSIAHRVSSHKVLEVHVQRTYVKGE